MPGRPEDPRWAVFITCVLSHLSMLLAVALLTRRQMRFESVMGLFALIVSFMYHTCETFNSVLFLSEMQWHRLDNIGAITAIGCSCIHLACFEDHAVMDYLQASVLFTVIILQEAAPWDIRYTVAPVLGCIGIPIASHILNPRRVHSLYVKRFVVGLLSCVIGGFFFALGLDDENDPYRIFHGMFHVCIGFGVFFFFFSLRRPLERRKSPPHSPRYDDAVAVVVNM